MQQTQLETMLDCYVTDRNAFLMSRARRAYREVGRGVMVLDLNDVAFKDGIENAPVEVHYRYIPLTSKGGPPPGMGRELLETYDPEKECVVVGVIDCPEGGAPHLAFRLVRELTPLMQMLMSATSRLFALAQEQYRKQGRGILAFMPDPDAPPLFDEEGRQADYAMGVAYVPRSDAA